VSLTSHLRDRGSLVRAWFAERLGATQIVVRSANTQLREGNRAPVNRILEPVRTRPLVPPVGDRALVGHAVDWLLRLCLVDEPPPRSSAAGLGAKRIALHDRHDRALTVFAATVERCNQIAPARRQLNSALWQELCSLCLLLGWLERAYRAPFADATILGLVDDAARLDEWLERLVRDLDLEDLARLGRAALEDHADLRDGRRLIANPTFALSAALGGADADLIAGTTLLDFKSTATTSIVGNVDLWQVVGYALADVDDHYGITDVGFSALRWRRRITWPLGSLLQTLAGQPLPPAVARSELRAILATHGRPAA